MIDGKGTNGKRARLWAAGGRGFGELIRYIPRILGVSCSDQIESTGTLYQTIDDGIERKSSRVQIDDGVMMAEMTDPKTTGLVRD